MRFTIVIELKIMFVSWMLLTIFYDQIWLNIGSCLSLKPLQVKTNDDINIFIFHKFSLIISLSSLITFHGTQRVQVQGKWWAICEKKRWQRDSKKKNSIFYKWPQSFVTLQSKTACSDKVARKVWYWQLLDKGRRYRGWCDASPCIFGWGGGGGSDSGWHPSLQLFDSRPTVMFPIYNILNSLGHIFDYTSSFNTIQSFFFKYFNKIIFLPSENNMFRFSILLFVTKPITGFLAGLNKFG